jgi:GNAT superfamily N-acetyltransferase
MNTSIQIRRMTATDAGAVAALADELGYPGDAEAIASRIARVASLADHAAFVAVRDDAIAGWIHLSVAHMIESATFVELKGLVVSGTARRCGIGAALVAAGVQWARDIGQCEMRVRSNVKREAAHAFYRACGFEDLKTQLNFKLRLD